MGELLSLFESSILISPQASLESLLFYRHRECDGQEVTGEVPTCLISLCTIVFPSRGRICIGFAEVLANTLVDKQAHSSHSMLMWNSLSPLHVVPTLYGPSHCAISVMEEVGNNTSTMSPLMRVLSHAL